MRKALTSAKFLDNSFPARDLLQRAGIRSLAAHRPHQGVDYGAPPEPIALAVGDGIVPSGGRATANKSLSPRRAGSLTGMPFAQET